MSNKAVTREGRKSNAILRTAFQKSESSTSSSQYEAKQRCNVWPSKSRTDRKRLNTRSFFAALKRECKKTFHNSTSERQLSTSTTPRSTSTTPVSTSTTSTSTTFFSSSTSTTSIDAGARVSVKAEHAAAANAELQERIDEIQAKLTAKYSGRDVSSTSTGSQGYYGVNTTSTTRSTSTTPNLLTSSSTTKVSTSTTRVSTSSTRLSSSTSTEFMISTSTTSLSSSFRRIPASTSSTAVTHRTSRSKKSAAARFQLNIGSSSTSRVVVDNRQNNDTFRSLSRKDSSSSSADWMRSRKGKSKKSAAARFQNL